MKTRSFCSLTRMATAHNGYDSLLMVSGNAGFAFRKAILVALFPPLKDFFGGAEFLSPQEKHNILWQYRTDALPRFRIKPSDQSPLLIHRIPPFRIRLLLQCPGLLGQSAKCLRQHLELFSKA